MQIAAAATEAIIQAVVIDDFVFWNHFDSI